MFCTGLFTQVKSEMNMLVSTSLCYNQRIRLMDNDSLNSRIELNSKEVIVKSCQMFKARFVHGRIKQKGCRCGRRLKLERACLRI